MFTWPVLIFAFSVNATGAERPVRAVSSVDLGRYAGRWFEIARYPNRFQDQCAGEVTALYEPREDGRIRVVNRCRRADGSVDEAEGVARVVAGSGNARLKVRFAPGWISFLPFVWGDYWVIGLADDYRWAVVGTPDRKYLWILSRAPEMTGDDRAAAESAIEENGFERSRLVPTPQPPEGRP